MNSSIGGAWSGVLGKPGKCDCQEREREPWVTAASSKGQPLPRLAFAGKSCCPQCLVASAAAAAAIVAATSATTTATAALLGLKAIAAKDRTIATGLKRNRGLLAAAGAGDRGGDSGATAAVSATAAVDAAAATTEPAATAALISLLGLTAGFATLRG